MGCDRDAPSVQTQLLPTPTDNFFFLGNLPYKLSQAKQAKQVNYIAEINTIGGAALGLMDSGL